LAPGKGVADLTDEEKTVRNTIDRLTARLKIASSEDLPATRTELDGLIRAQLRLESSHRNAVTAANNREAVLDLNELFELLGPDTLLLDYFVGDASTYLWALGN